MTDMTEQELQREVEAQALADRVWEIISQRVHSQLEGVIALEPDVLHPHIDLWFAHRTNHDLSKVGGNLLTDLIADSLSSNYRMQMWFKQRLRAELVDMTQKMSY
jgi:hypothetical protein